MSSYSKPVGVDKKGTPLPQWAIPTKAVVTTVSENATASSVITFNDNTTDLEITAVGAPAFVRWIPRSDTQASVISAAGTANFDNVIPAGVVRRFVVPVEQAGTSSTVGANIANGLYNRVAYKTAGVGSIITIQY